jgi:hypothetical protein
LTITRYFTLNSYISAFVMFGVGLCAATLYKLEAKYLGVFLIWNKTFSQICLWLSTYLYDKWKLHEMILYSLIGDLFVIASMILLLLGSKGEAVKTIFFVGLYHTTWYAVIRYEKQKLLRKVSDEDFKKLKKLEQRCHVVGGTLGAIGATYFHDGAKYLNEDIFVYMAIFECINFVFAIVQYSLASKIPYDS